ncbi:MAG: hypothetical protein WA777_13290 [Rhodanobacter sp.]
MDASPTELAFRKVERELDDLLATSVSELSAMGIARADSSTRTYHYKESHLRWEVQFERRWPKDLFIQQVQIILSYGEPIEPEDAPRVGVFRRAESFRQGQVSSIDEQSEESHPLETVRKVGIVGIIKPHLVAAAALLDITV